MKIIISKSIYGKSYICGLSAPFTYIGYILSELLGKIPQFPFSEIEIECCNFVYELKDDEGYMQWFRKLPLYRKRKDSVHIYLHKINDELKLNSILEDIEQAFNIILLKNKKNIGYDWNKVQGALINLQNILKNNDIWVIHKQYDSLVTQKQIEERKQEREVRNKSNQKANRLIQDLRLYYHFENVGKLFFSPFDTLLCKEVLLQLRKNRFLLPQYSHLYIMVSNTFNNALSMAVRYEQWYIYGIATLDNYTEYPNLTDRQKAKIVFNIIKMGLNDVAKIDKLDTHTLNKVLDKVELTYFESM